MATREIVDYARNFAIMVRVQGPVSHYLSCPFSMLPMLVISVEMVKNRCKPYDLGPEGPEDAQACIPSVSVRTFLSDRFIWGLYVSNLENFLLIPSIALHVKLWEDNSFSIWNDIT